MVFYANQFLGLNSGIQLLESLVLHEVTCKYPNPLLESACGDHRAKDFFILIFLYAHATVGGLYKIMS